MYPKVTLRLEGAGIAAVATVAYFALGGSLWLFVVLALAPDISILTYLAGLRVGSHVYNAFHTYLAPVTLGAAGVLLSMTSLLWIALVWAAHIGVDRAAGYGLKYPTGFKHTHLSGAANHNIPAGKPAEVVSEATGTGDD
ncbi:MAG: DUF4260 domain-containing protein [Halapricum sp.]